MDQHVTVPLALPAVFNFLASPRHLASWLVEVRGADGLSASTTDVWPEPEQSFGLRLEDGCGVGELIGYEPPSYLAYRLRFAATSHVVRISLTADGGQTRIGVHQADQACLTVDLPGLQRALLQPDLAT